MKKKIQLTRYHFRFQDMTIDQFREIRSKAGGLIVLLPKDLRALTVEQKEVIIC
jgi:hypothetical protein